MDASAVVRESALAHRRVLVTGANGFIGRHLVAALARRHHVFGVTRGLDSVPRLAGVEWIEQDLGQPISSGLLPPRIDAVVHLAQSRSYREFPEKAADIFRVNVGSTQDLLDHARLAGAETFVL